MWKIRVPATVIKHRTLIVIALGSFGVGAVSAVGILLLIQSQSTNQPPRALRQSDVPNALSEYKFIDPLIATKGFIDSPKYNEMKRDAEAYIAEEKKNGLATVTIYFRDIRQQGGFTVNPDELYTPASLYKVPIMMVYYKIAERDPSILKQKIYYSGAVDSNRMEEIRSPMHLTPRTSYTVEQLIEYMIRYPDNNAVQLLTQHLKDTKNSSNFTDFSAVFSDLGIDLGTLNEYSDVITAQQYSLFLRALYNATDLDRTDSEHALQLLSETDFTEGIRAGVPHDVVVAEKFGEARMSDSNGTVIGKQLNECGIIYYPEHPYLLCIMTKTVGTNVPLLEKQVSTLSALVYRNMQKLYPN